MHFCTVFARCSRAWNTYQWRYGNRLSYARNIQSREFPCNGRTGEVPEMCISFTSRQCMSVGIIEQREMDVITLVLHLIVFILAPKVCVTKITDANIRCKTFEENGEKTLGFVTRLPHGKTPCYELDGYFNCNGLAGEDRNYCVKTCCKDAKRYTGLKIKCIVFTNEVVKEVKGFSERCHPISTSNATRMVVYLTVKPWKNQRFHTVKAHVVEVRTTARWKMSMKCGNSSLWRLKIERTPVSNKYFSFLTWLARGIQWHCVTTKWRLTSCSIADYR